MKTLLYITNHKYIKVNGVLYTTGLMTNDIFLNYLEIFDKIMVLGTYESLTQDEASVTNKIIHNKRIEYNLKKISNGNSFTRALAVKPNVKQFINKVNGLAMKVPCIIAGYVLKICKKNNLPCVFEVIGCSFDALWHHGHWAGKILAPLLMLQEKKYIKNASNCIYVSQFFLQERYPTKGRYLSCPDIVLEESKKETLNLRINKIKLSSNNKGYSLGTFGNLNVKYRGIDTSLKVLKILINKNINAKLIIIGGGDKKKWQKYCHDIHVHDRVIFTGSITRDKIFKYLDFFDYVILPTKAETLGRFAIEAMSRGCPVIGTKETALWEQLGADCLVHIDDAETIASKIIYFIKNKNYTKYCAYENYYRSFKYTKEIINKKRKEFYKECYK